MLRDLYPLLLLGAAAAAQESLSATRPALSLPASRPSDWTAAEARAALAELEKTLDHLEQAPSPQSRATSRELVTRFLSRCPNTDAARPYRLTARALLARIALLAFDLRCAEEQFEGMLQEAQAPSDEEFRHRALYGLAQVSEARGDLERARERYLAVYQDKTLSRYTSFARAALEQIKARTTLRRGAVVPKLPSRRDLEGLDRPLGELQERILLLLFWSPASLPSRKALAETRRALAHLSGEASFAVVTVALDTRREDVDRARREDEITWPVLWDRDHAGWMDPLALRFGVRTLPASVLIGPGSRFVAADLPTPELASAIETLLKSRR
jgi:hypothetical protein